MKLVIEISNEDLMAAVDQQMGKVIAETVTENIKAEMDKIIAIKLERITPKVIDEAICKEVNRLMGTNAGDRDKRIYTALISVAENMLKSHLER